MDHLRDLALFVAVAEARNFTRAAEVLDQPVSTVSRRLAELEASLGLRLLNRTTRKVELTEAGTLYLARAHSILAAARDAHQEVRDLAEVPSGHLRLSVEAEVGPRLVAPLIAEFLAQYPTVTVEVDLSPRRVDLLAEHFDLAIRLGRLEASTLTIRRLALLQGGLYAAPSYLARCGTPNHPSELIDHSRVQLLHRGDRGEWRLGRDGEVFDVQSIGLAVANNMTMIRHLAVFGVGIAVLDELMAKADLASGALVRVLPEWTLPPVALSVLTPSRLLPAKTRVFVDMLAERITGIVGLN